MNSFIHSSFCSSRYGRAQMWASGHNQRGGGRLEN
jgi:hypothetical protein